MLQDLTVEKAVDQEKNNYGLCKCGCGQKTWVSNVTHKKRHWIKGKPVKFIKGHNSKMNNDMNKFLGKRFHRLKIISYSHHNKYGLIYVNCICKCGNEITIRMSSLINRSTRSCGCLLSEIMSKKNGKKNPFWKGSKVSYSGLHKWLARHYGYPERCDMCGTKDSKRYEWANISKKYKRNIKDFKRLCRKCHIKFDRETKCSKN